MTDSPPTPEEWRPIAYAPGYSVSSLGRIQSSKTRGRGPADGILRGWLDKKGYRKVFVYDAEGCRLERFVHRLVAEAFDTPSPEATDVRHLDGDKTNNAATNVRFGTRSENELDKVRHGTHQNSRKTHCKHGHAFDEANTGRDRRGDRYCRTCARARLAAHHARRGAA